MKRNRIFSQLLGGFDCALDKQRDDCGVLILTAVHQSWYGVENCAACITSTASLRLEIYNAQYNILSVHIM